MVNWFIYLLNINLFGSFLFSQIPTAVTLSDTAQLGDREVTVGETRSTTPTCQKIVKNPVAPAKPA